MIDFKYLGVCEQLCRICNHMGFRYATKIQAQVIPYALKGKDIIACAQTGSGKTLAFVIPILQSMLNCQSFFHSLVIVPARELAFQIATQIEIIGNAFGVKTALLIGGVDSINQIFMLKKKPHVVICTPGRLNEHVEKSHLQINCVKKIVFDEADRLFECDFDKEFSLILSGLSLSKQSFLFSATMTTKIEKLSKISMINPMKIQVDKKYKISSTLVQNYIFVPLKFKDSYLVYICNKFYNTSIIIFVDTQVYTEKIAFLLKALSFDVLYLHGKMNQNKRIKILYDFKINKIKMLVTTNLISRGIDLSKVKLIINYDIPLYTKDYVHRIGRTARTGRTGRVINLVTQYDIYSCQKIEFLLEKKFIEFKCNLKKIMMIVKYIYKIKNKINKDSQTI